MISPDPFYPYSKQPVPVPPAAADDPNSHAERAKLTDLSIGDYGKPAAHESGCAIRMFRAGFTGAQASETLGVPPGEFQRQFKVDMDKEGEAHHAGRPIWDQKMPKGAK